jgi:hypothetical protein
VGIAPNYPIAEVTNAALLTSLQGAGGVKATPQSVRAHLQQLLQQGEKETAWLWVDKPLKTACTLLASTKPTNTQLKIK